MLTVRPSAVAVLLFSLATAPASSQGTTAKIWENYDFVPGSKVLFCRGA